MIRWLLVILSVCVVVSGAVGLACAESPSPRSEGTSLDLGALLSARDDEDAPGSDEGDLPRPARSIRVLTARLDAQGTSLRVYRTTASVAAVEAELASAARASFALRMETGEEGTLAFRRRTTLTIVRLLRTESGTFASLIEMPFGSSP